MCFSLLGWKMLKHKSKAWLLQLFPKIKEVAQSTKIGCIKASFSFKKYTWWAWNNFRANLHVGQSISSAFRSMCNSLVPSPVPAWKCLCLVGKLSICGWENKIVTLFLKWNITGGCHLSQFNRFISEVGNGVFNSFGGREIKGHKRSVHVPSFSFACFFPVL